MRPTLDELDDFLSGQADEVTRERIGGDLLTPESPLRLSLEGARIRAEGLTGWTDAYDGEAGDLARIAEAVRHRSTASMKAWSAFVASHIAYWLFWAAAWMLLTFDVSESVPLSVLAGPGIWLAALVLGLLGAKRRGRPWIGSLWEAIIGTYAAWPFLVLDQVVRLLDSNSIGLAHVVATLRYATAIGIVGTSFLGSLTGLYFGFGLRGRLAAEKLTLRQVATQWLFLTISYSSFGGLIASLAWLAGNHEAAIPWAIGGILAAGWIASVMSIKQESLHASPIQVAIALVTGIAIGLPLGAWLGFLEQVPGSSDFVVAAWTAVLGGYMGTWSCGFAVWFGFEAWKKEAGFVLRLYLGGGAGLLLVHYIGFPILGALERNAVLPTSPGLAFLVLVTFTGAGIYLGMSDKWMLAVPRGVRVWFESGWQRLSVSRPEHIAPSTREAAWQVVLKPWAETMRIYRWSWDTLIATLTEATLEAVRV